ncbi:nucleotidyltransferase family protein [Raineyella sp.]|uniref:nucleotidyltransferase family protein n=1 Tax=Raineyella sp. TaxID=1911550 RepID=UPI002B220D5E|nr:nucleotidyltransferase family protein [Raineyella sp.]MEA5153982.1 nucleotidyltransferase family protein [Raineyella sp.]
MHAPIDVPVWQRIQLGHAVLEVIAEDAGVDILHLKGPALDPVLAPAPRYSTDADVLVRPSQLETFLAEVPRHGWSLVAGFADGSPFEHAATFRHPEWGYVDVHRRFPGLPGDEATFDRLWRDRSARVIAGRPCPTPSVVAQRLVLMLHAARKDSPHGVEDMHRAWGEADDATRQDIRDLVVELGAEIGFAAATGHLDDFRGTPEGRLWAAFTGHGSRLGEWRARFGLARGWRARLGILAVMVRVNRPRLEMELGHPPTRSDVARAYVARVTRALREIGQAIGRRATVLRPRHRGAEAEAEARDAGDQHPTRTEHPSGPTDKPSEPTDNPSEPTDNPSGSMDHQGGGPR